MSEAALRRRTKTRPLFAIGNGLGKEVWEKFTDRYSVGKVVEFYAATEGNANLMNNAGRVGSCGLVPRWASFIYPVAVLRCNRHTGAIERVGKYAQRCGVGEPGHLVGLIRDNDPSRRFDGYTDAKATAAKVAENVFRDGDRYFLTGDIVECDAQGFHFFIDRIGDTFRWKGENISTTQVAGVCGSAPGVAHAIVYGVKVPGSDGAAGMASIISADDTAPIDWGALQERMDADLPPAARPVFVRTCAAVPMTQTFKYQKQDLKTQGWDQAQVGTDKLFVRDHQSGTYVALTAAVRKAINGGTWRL